MLKIFTVIALAAALAGCIVDDITGSATPKQISTPDQYGVVCYALYKPNGIVHGSMSCVKVN